MSDEEMMSFQVQHAPIDSVIDGYYTLSDGCDWPKIVAMKRIMKGAINITKSKTGEAILKTNRVERAQLRYKIESVRREKTKAEANVNREKIVFKAKYSKWMNSKKGMPKRIRVLREKYKRIRSDLRSRKMTRTNTVVSSVFKTALSRNSTKPDRANMFADGVQSVAMPCVKDELHTQLCAKNYLATPALLPKVSSNESMTSQRGVLSGGRQLVSRDQLSRRQTAIWREKTFNMDSIRTMLIDQDLRQQSMFCKLRINRYRDEKRKLESTAHDKFKLTTALAIERQRSASTVSELRDSRPVSEETRKTSGLFPPLPNSTGGVIKSHADLPSPQDVLYRAATRTDTAFSLVKPLEDLRLKNKQVSFYT